jgi:hypothetical protein
MQSTGSTTPHIFHIDPSEPSVIPQPYPNDHLPDNCTIRRHPDTVKKGSRHAWAASPACGGEAETGSSSDAGIGEIIFQKISLK